MPLSPAEDELLAECHRRYYSKPTERVSFGSDGSVSFHKQVDVEPLMDVMKHYGDVIRPHQKTAAGAKMVGAIDPITAAIWQKETGLRIGTKEFGQYARKKLLHDTDYRRFRVGGI